MPVSAEALRTHIEYTTWASMRLLDTAAKLPANELAHDFQTSDRSILNTLVHIFAADRVWLARLTGAPQGAFVTNEDRSLAVLQREWPALLDRWKTYAAGLSDAEAQTNFTYMDLAKRTWTQPIWQLMLHVVNHATHHRGQVSGFLRTLGHTPPPLDLVHFYRGL